MSTLGSRSVARNGKVLPAGFLERRWKKGESGNPSGHTAEYGEVVALARSLAPRAIERLGELLESEDERVAAVACTAILDRAFGKPQPRPLEKNDEGVARIRRMSPEERLEDATRLKARADEVLARVRARQSGGDNQGELPSGPGASFHVEQE